MLAVETLALVTVQILARRHDHLRERLAEYHEDSVEDVAATSGELTTWGPRSSGEC